VVPYGRCPRLIAHILAMLRCAMGDFAPIDMYQTYDLIKDPNAEGDDKYIHSYTLVMFTWFIFIISIFMLFMVFMNFIIAVIGESYSKVIENKAAHDYK